jgi:hypothetical protein
MRSRCVKGAAVGMRHPPMAKTPANRASAVARGARDDVLEHARKLSTILKRTASALEHSAAIAEEHAERRRRSGDDEGATREHEAAARASAAARRARARADEAEARRSSGPGEELEV